ncbi:MAG: hypothetical protein LIP01_05720 [Tannerellaceae bacterium]|nr:hypothetical protein [Tannerellaceae bacterium]
MWPQELTYTVYNGNKNTEVTITFDEKEKPFPIPEEFKNNIQAILPNTNGKGYGFFHLNQQDAEYSIRELQTTQDEVLKGSLLITLHENLLHGTISPEWFTEKLLDYIQQEENTLLFSTALSYTGNCLRLYPVQSSLVETKLWETILTNSNEQHRLQAFRLYSSVTHSEAAIQKLYEVWAKQKPPTNCYLSENDYINLSYLLALHLPEQAETIIQKQQSRLTNPDRIKEYAFIPPAVSLNPATRDSVFNALLMAGNRRIEPWASTALAYLNHHTRQREAIKYIRPALEKLQEIQRTGDIFFPTAWVRALLSGHQSAEAWQEIESFFRDNPDYPEMLSNKIKQQSDFLYRRTHLLE